MNVDNHSSPANSSSTQLKRKSPDEAQEMSKDKDDAQTPRSKKPKTQTTAKPDASDKKAIKSVKATEGEQDASKANEEPVRCHQCTRHFEPAGERRCLGWLAPFLTWRITSHNSLHVQEAQWPALCAQVLQSMLAKQISARPQCSQKSLSSRFGDGKGEACGRSTLPLPVSSVFDPTSRLLNSIQMSSLQRHM